MTNKLQRYSTERFKLRKLLVVLMLLALLPLIVSTGILLAQLFHQQDEQTRSMLLARARTISNVMDREFLRTQAVLKTLSYNNLWEQRQFAQFHAQAQQAAIDLGASSIVLISIDGQMVLSTKRPFGTLLPMLKSPPLLPHTLSTGLPGVSDIFVNPIDKQYIYAVSVPLREKNEISYSLDATFSSSALSGILTEQKLPPSWRAAIIDKQGKIVCRTHESARFTGSSVLPQLRERLDSGQEGTYNDITLDGIPVMTAYSRSPFSHWSIVIGAPLAESEASAREFLTNAVIMLAIALVAGIAIIWWLSAYIVRPETSLQKHNGNNA